MGFLWKIKIVVLNKLKNYNILISILIFNKSIKNESIIYYTEATSRTYKNF